MTDQINAIELLLLDHQSIERLVEQLDAADDPAETRDLSCASLSSSPPTRRWSSRSSSRRSELRSRAQVTTPSPAAWASTRS